MIDKSEKTVLISGCSSGIGQCATELLSQRGYRVFAGARKPADVEALCAGGYEGIRLDLDDDTSISTAVEEVMARTGGTLYGLFNNGAWGQIGAVEDLSRELLRRQLETNLLGTHELTRQVIPVMRRQGYGRIVQNSSILGLVCLPFRGAYNCSKYALEGLSDTLRMELQGTNIHVSLIEPGPILSRFRANAYATFKQNIDPASSVWRTHYEQEVARLNKQGAAAPGTLGPEAVVRKLLLALESRRPKARYYVTTPTFMLAGLKWLLPDRMMDRVLAKTGGL